MKKDRGAYFVEYQPPSPDSETAFLHLTFGGEVELAGLDRLMETEIRAWLQPYPVSTMAWAFDSADNSLKPAGKPGTCLVGWVGGSGSPVTSWNIDDLTTHLQSAKPVLDYKVIFAGLPFKTRAERKVAIDANLIQTIRQNKFLRLVLLGWLVIIPAAWAIIQLFGPNWLAIAITIYGLWRAWGAYAKLTGRRKPSPKEIKDAEIDRRKAHYIYHCERNPAGFERLKLENLEAEARKRVKVEHDQIAAAEKDDSKG